MVWVILFTIDDLFTKRVKWWDGRKTPKYKNECKNQGKNSPFDCPPIPSSTKWRPTVFRCPKTPKTSRTYPKWERDPYLMGPKRQGWAQLMTAKIPKPTEQGLQSEDIEKRRQGATPPDRTLDRECPRTPFVHLHHCLRVVVHHVNPSAELRLESGDLQNSGQKPMVNPIEGLGLI